MNGSYMLYKCDFHKRHSESDIAIAHATIFIILETRFRFLNRDTE